MQQKFEELSGYSPDDASDIGIRLKVLAGEIYSICAAVDWLKTQTFAQTATDAQLEMRAQERGLFRKPAAAASGTLTFGRSTALWFNVTIPEGTVCASSGTGAARYVTTQDATLPQGSLTVSVPAAAEEAGAAGNANSATVTVMVTPPASIETVTNTAAFTGGEDAESDDSLRARLLSSYAAPANGTNAAWYRQAAQTVAADVTCTVENDGAATDAAMVTACRQAILDYFGGLAVGEAVVLSAMTAKLFATGLISDCSFSTAGRTMAANQLAVIGALTVTAGS